MKNIYLIALSFFLSMSVAFGQNRVYAPELQAPENGAIDQTPAVVLNWHAVAGSGMEIKYEVQLADNDAFDNPTQFPLSIVTALNASELNFGQTYFWRVRAHDGDEVSGWSEVWSFSVIKTVDVTQPTDGSVVTPQALMRWAPVEGVSFYQVLVDTTYSWRHEDVGFSESVRSTYVLDANSYGGVGDDGLIFYYDGQWKKGESGTTKDLLGVYFVAPDNGWAVGKSGTVLHFDGTAWSSVDIGTSSVLNAISFADANNGWIVGNGGLVYFNDGSGWVTQDTITIDTNGTTTNLNAVWAVSPTDVWAGGKSGYIAHYDGTSWSVEKPGTKDIMAFWFNAPNDGWATQKSGRVSHFDGTSWTEEATGVSKIFYGIAFNGSEGYIVGSSGTLMTYDGSGWVKVTSGTNKDIYGIWFADGVGLYGGKNGAVYTYTGGGFDSPYATTYTVNGDLDSLYLENLFFGATYYYKMRMGHSKDTSDWTLPGSFQVQKSPILSSPSDGKSNTALKVILSWEEFTGILKYNIQISTNEEFTGALTYASDSLSYPVTGLSFNTKYYWRINAQHAVASSPWSEVWSFTTTNTITLVSPENNATGINACPLLKWEGVDGVAKYEIWIDTDENFSNPMSKVETLTSSQCQSQLQKGTDYYWKVRGIVALDTSDWSPAWKFTTEEAEGIEESIGFSSLSLFPNPAGNGNFTIQLNSLVNSNVVIRVADVSGRIVYNRSVDCNVGHNSYSINLQDWSAGVYQVSIKRDNAVVTRKLIVR